MSYRLQWALVTCSACGSPLPDGAQKCAVCGTAVTAALPQTSLSARTKKKVSETKASIAQVDEVLVGRYRLTGKIGEGGMGTVFSAIDLELDRKVAVKLLAEKMANDAEVLERFEREARLTAKLDHPHIVPIYDVGRHEGRPFLVMKLLQGDSLAGRLRSKGGFSVEDTFKLMRQLASGLDYIHSQGFIHRDIKAGNIFVSPDGHATILDFGIFRQMSAEGGITRAGMVMGTPHYMAPEQALGQRDLDHRVDLYALAVVLFECLTGTLPFEADSELRLIQLQAHAPVPELLDRAPWIPPQVAAVVKRALAKNPEERFNSAAQMVAALEAAHLESLKAPASPKSRVLYAAQPAPKSTWKVWTLLGLVSMGALGALFLFLQPAPPPAVTIGPVIEPPADAGVTPEPEPIEVFDAGAPDIEEFDAGIETAAAVGPKKVVGAKRKGRVNIITTHDGEPYWAQVSIDGVARGRTPLLLDLAVGKYQLRIERPGFRSVSQELRVLPGKSMVVKFELEP